MEMLYSKLIGTPVWADGVRPLTTVKDVVIDPNNGKVIGYMTNLSKKLMISPMDIVDFKKGQIRVTGDVIVEAEEIIRVSAVLSEDIKIFRNKVVSEDGHYLGKVYDFSIETVTDGLKNLYVAKDFLGLIRWDGRIIHYKNIVEIKASEIVVKSSTEEVEEMPELKEVTA